MKAVPETVVLQRPEEDVSRLLNVPAEQLLLRWVAHHIGAAGAAWEAWLPLKDMGPDLADCTALGCLLAQLEPQTASVIDFRFDALLVTCPPLKVMPPVMGWTEVNYSGGSSKGYLLSLFSSEVNALPRRETDLVARAGMVLEAAALLTSEPLPPARSLAEGDADMVMMLLASLFRARHGLQGAAAEREGQMTQFAQWLEEYDVQVRRLTGFYTAPAYLVMVPSTSAVTEACLPDGQISSALKGTWHSMPAHEGDPERQASTPLPGSPELPAQDACDSQAGASLPH